MRSFRQQVFDLVCLLPKGRLASYGQVARMLGRPRSARAVGGALASLRPADGPVPWFRVVNRLGGLSPRHNIFLDGDGTEEQRARLRDEGVIAEADGRYRLEEYGLSDAQIRSFFPTEMLEVVDLSNRTVEIVDRATVRAENLLHRGVGILCWNSNKELFVHQRTATKDLFPSYYDMMVGGALEAGEVYEEAALREVQEELGVGEVEADFLFETLYDGPRNRSFIQLFEVTWDGPIRCQEEEICWGRWMGFDEVLEWVKTVPIVPDGEQIFEEYLRTFHPGQC